MSVTVKSEARSRLIEAAAFAGANSVAYLEAVFDGYARGRVVAVLPRVPVIRSIPGVKIVERRSFEDAPGWYEDRHDPIRSDAPAQITFSSGTTGRPKPLLLSHRALADVTDRINAAMQVDGTISEYVGVPVTFSFGFGRVRAVAAAGGRAFLPQHGFDPAEIARMLSAGEINAISAVPTLWRVLLANPDVIGDEGRKVRWIEIGSQYMARSEKEAMKRLFPNARIVQHYGLTEASRSTLLDISTTEGDALESVGVATGEVAVAISEDGLIRIRGPHLADGLVTGAGVKPITDADGWLTTADRGAIRDGLLYFEGRADDQINCGGVKVNPDRFEQQLGERLGQRDAVAVGRVQDPLRGERILLAIRRGAGVEQAAVAAAATAIAAEYGLTAAGALAYRTVEEFPRTATGKLRRAALAEMAEADAAATEPAVDDAEPEATEKGGGAVQPGADPRLERAEALQAIWAKALGLPTVSLHESFYDLGGDSLSALTVIMRMEREGVDPAVARGIFEGKSIAELVGLEAEPAPPPAPAPHSDAPPAVAESAATAAIASDDPRLAKAEALREIWAKALSLPTVSLNESFYDLGGDSLSALTVIMRMEAQGIDPATARGIFEGKSIAELVGMEQEAIAPKAVAKPAEANRPPSGPTPQTGSATTGLPAITMQVWSINALRGVMILVVLLGHWGPGVIERLFSPAQAAEILGAMLPLFRLGTPGFVFTFGVGAGFFLLRDYANKWEAVRKRILVALVLLASAHGLLAATHLAELAVLGRPIGGLQVANAFYGVLAYFVVAFLTLPIWLWCLDRLKAGIPTILSIALGFWILGWFAKAIIPPHQIDGLLEWPKLMLIAKYNYLNLSAIAFVGIALGRWLCEQTDPIATARHLIAIGGLGTAAAILTVIEAYPDAFSPLAEDRRFSELAIYGMYAALGTFLVGVFLSIYAAWRNRPPLLRILMQGLIVFGLLALPIYAFHQIVIPAKDMLLATGVPGTAALGVPLALFLGGMGYLWVRLFKMHF